MKTALERILNTEMDVHLGERTTNAEILQVDDALTKEALPSSSKNRRNGYW